MTWGEALADQTAGQLDILLTKWGNESNLIGFWVADDCAEPGSREAAIIAELKAQRTDLLAIICQDVPNGAGIKAVGGDVEFDQVYSFKGPEREISRLCKQAAENHIAPWVIVNIQFKDHTLDFSWVISTLHYAKSKGIRSFWYFNVDESLFDGKHDLSGLKQLNADLLK